MSTFSAVSTTTTILMAGYVCMVATPCRESLTYWLHHTADGGQGWLHLYSCSRWRASSAAAAAESASGQLFPVRRINWEHFFIYSIGCLWLYLVPILPSILSLLSWAAEHATDADAEVRTAGCEFDKFPQVVIIITNWQEKIVNSRLILYCNLNLLQLSKKNYAVPLESCSVNVYIIVWHTYGLLSIR